MGRKEKQWEVEDKNLRTMGTENSRQIQIRISGHHFLGVWWCPFTPAPICMRASWTEPECLYIQVLCLFCALWIWAGIFVIWICSIFVPSPISEVPEFEVTRVVVGGWGYRARFLSLCWKAPITAPISLSPIHFLLSRFVLTFFGHLDLSYICYIFTFWCNIILDYLKWC